MNCYKIKKEIHFGQNFVEHVHPSFQETWTGLWKKVGHSVNNSQSSLSYLCDNCKIDFERRTHLVNPNNNTTTRSYQVRGYTKTDDLWRWEFHVCRDKSCWGRDIRLLDIQRANGRFMFYFFNQVKGSTNQQVYFKKDVERLYFRTKREALASRLEECGSICRSNRVNLFLNKESFAPKKYIHFKMNSRESVPEEYFHRNLTERPPIYQTPVYIYPLKFEIDMFLSDSYLERTELHDIQRSCNHIEKIMMNMYPGGAGMEVLQFKKAPHDPTLSYKMQKTPWIPDHVFGSKYDGYIAGIQNGYIGPIVSYWGRVHSNLRYFS